VEICAQNLPCCTLVSNNNNNNNNNNEPYRGECGGLKNKNGSGFVGCDIKGSYGSNKVYHRTGWVDEDGLNGK